VKSTPVGVMSRRYWLRVRVRYPPQDRDPIRAQALLNAVFRYRAAGMEPPSDWSVEYAEILARKISGHEE
jgi:hypothetical protein